jgi:hypothetical protein
MSRKPQLVIVCRGLPFLGGAPITAAIDGEPVFLAWDKPSLFELSPGIHGLEISYEPIRWPFGANKLARSIELNAGFRYNLTYIPRLAPMLPPKIELLVDRPV